MFNLCFKQRPTAKELLKHPFIKKAKRTTYLTELIERFREWKARGGAGQQSDSDSSSDEDMTGRADNDGWIDTIKELKHQTILSNPNNQSGAQYRPTIASQLITRQPLENDIKEDEYTNKAAGLLNHNQNENNESVYNRTQNVNLTFFS